MVVCMARPELDEVRPTWSESVPDALRMALAPLAAGELDVLLDNLLEGAEFPAALDSRCDVLDQDVEDRVVGEVALRIPHASGRLPGARRHHRVVGHAGGVGVEDVLPVEELAVELLDLLGLVGAELEPGDRVEGGNSHDTHSLRPTRGRL